jgi:hypothetical protein
MPAARWVPSHALGTSQFTSGSRQNGAGTAEIGHTSPGDVLSHENACGPFRSTESWTAKKVKGARQSNLDHAAWRTTETCHRPSADLH